MSIVLQFAAGTDIESLAIEWFGGTPGYSHVDAVMVDGRLLGARSAGGVQIRDPAYLGAATTLRVSLPATDDQFVRYWQFLQAQVGKPYDMRAIIAFIAGRDWRDPDSWFCSELIAAALEKAGIIRPLASPMNKVTPGDLLLILSVLVPISIPSSPVPTPAPGPTDAGAP